MFITFVGSPILQDYLYLYREQVELSFFGKMSLKGGIIVLPRKKTTCLLLNSINPICVLLRP